VRLAGGKRRAAPHIFGLHALALYVLFTYNAIMKKNATFRLSEEAMRLLATLAQRRGISRTAVLEMLIREAARRDEREEGQEQRTK
jgi:Ribbon-helix-helix protein, copG family